MKKTMLLVAVLFCALSLYAQDPVVKFYLNDASQAIEYKIDDITQINFIKSNPNTSMLIYQKGTTYSYMITNLISIEFIDSTQIKINLSNSSENFNIADIESIIFIPNSCTEIVIGTQTWMCKNLDVNHYRNGDLIPEVKDSTKWVELTTGAWCYYKNDPANGAIYGKLYNWYAVNDPRGLAPDGWHIPSDSEWTTLSTYLGGESVAGGKLKEVGTTHWASPNEGATNETGLSALPGGYRHYSVFHSRGIFCCWWSSTGYYTTTAWYRSLYYDNSIHVRNNIYKGNGFSVRCVKD